MAGGVEYQVTKVDPTDPETKGMVYQVHKVDEVTAYMSGKFYRARVIKNPSEPTVKGKVYQIVLIDDPEDPSVKGKVYNAILTGDTETIVVGPAPSPLSLPDAVANSLSYVKAFGGTEQRNLPDGYLQRQFIYMMDESYIDTGIVPDNAGKIEIDFQTTSVQTRNTIYFGTRTNTSTGAGVTAAHTNTAEGVFDAFGQRFSPTQTFANNTRYLISYDNGTIVWKSGSTVIYTNTTTPTDTTTHSLYINALNNAGTVYGNYEGIYLYSFKVWNAQGVLVADYVPAVQVGAVPVVGFYDTVSKTFKTATAGTFAAGGEAVPTPDTPMDIVSNNGVLKARHASGLPLGYTLLDYIESTGTQAISTGINYDGNDFVVKWKAVDNSTSNSTLFATKASSPFGGGFYGTNSSRKYYVGTQPAGGMTINYSSNDGLVHTWEATVSGQNATLKKDGTQVGTDTFTGTIDTTRSIYLFCGGWASSSDPTLGQFARWRLYSWQLWKSGVLAGNFIPAKRNSDNVIGMYDTVSGQFFTNAGTGDFVAGDPVSDPVGIYADGVVETLQLSTLPAGYLETDYSTNSSATSIQTPVYFDFSKNYEFEIRVKAQSGSWYILQSRTSSTGNIVGLAGGNSGSTIIWGVTYDSGIRSEITRITGHILYIKATTQNGVLTLYVKDETAGTEDTQTGTYTPDSTVMSRPVFLWGNGFQNVAQDSDVYMAKIKENGVTLVDYVPCIYNGTAGFYDRVSETFKTNTNIAAGNLVNTATAEMLLSLGDYTDEQEIISGVVTRKLGVAVLDGTETWTKNSAGIFACQNLINGISNQDGYCTHFKKVADTTSFGDMTVGTYKFRSSGDRIVYFNYDTSATVSDWTTWLADQYAAGTPVIIVYPLAEPTTDTVTGQPMNTTAGDNILEITQASLDKLELEAKYEKEVA